LQFWFNFYFQARKPLVMLSKIGGSFVMRPVDSHSPGNHSRMALNGVMLGQGVVPEIKVGAIIALKYDI